MFGNQGKIVWSKFLGCIAVLRKMWYIISICSNNRQNKQNNNGRSG